MDGTGIDPGYHKERRRRLLAERRLDHTRRELERAHGALVANADRLSRRYLSERETNLKLTERQQAVLLQRKEAADRADRARRRLWHALETMRDGFALFDAQGRLVAANNEYLALFDAASDVGPGCHATEIFERAVDEGAFDIGDLSPQDWARAQAARWDVEGIEPLVLEHYDGRVLRFIDRRAPDGDIVSLALDVTDQRAREQALATARDEAHQMARAKSDFLARMSHEIRTPMNGVVGMAQMLEESAQDGDAAMFARTIRESAEALLVIVNDTLDVSKLEAGKVELREETLDLEALLIDCLRLLERTARPGVEVALSYPFEMARKVRGDAGRIRQIVMNLLGNALKFTETGHVVVDVGAGATGLSIAVEDTGPGIPQNRAATVFEAFGQIEAAGKIVHEGTGLGLTISRGLAERMGGTLTLSEALGGGARFTLTVPLEVEAEDAGGTPPGSVAIPENAGQQAEILARGLARAGWRVAREVTAQATCVLIPSDLDLAAQAALVADLPAGARLVLLGAARDMDADLVARSQQVLCRPVAGAALLAALTAQDDIGTVVAAPAVPVPRLIVADDNATNRLLLDRMLRGQNFEVDLVEDGAQAVAAYTARRPDAVILDISMPGVDGFEAARQIHALEAARGGEAAPILALTAHVGEEMSARLTEAGFEAHLTKPLKKDVLLAALEQALTSVSASPA